MPRTKEALIPARKSAARMAAVQALYQIELSGLRPEKIIADFQAGHIPNEADVPIKDFDGELFAEIVSETVSKQAEIDQALQAHLDPRWPIERLEKILKALLRAGAAELLSAHTDAPIVINDYMNIAHGFFGGKEPALVNAVLDKLAKKQS